MKQIYIALSSERNELIAFTRFADADVLSMQNGVQVSAVPLYESYHEYRKEQGPLKMQPIPDETERKLAWVGGFIAMAVFAYAWWRSG